MAGAALLPSVAQAQNVWAGTGSTTATTNYNLGTNWSTPPAGAPPVAGGQSAQFANTGSAAVVVTAGPIAPDSWTFNANAQSYAVSGQAVNFGGTGLVNNANAGQAISIANNISGAGSVTQSGASTLTISGTNGYTGGTSVQLGTLRVLGTLGSTASNTTVSGGILDLQATTQTQAQLQQSGGTVQNGNMNVTTYQLTGGTLAASATVSAGTTFDLQAGTVNGVLAGSGAVSKTTAGTVTLNNADTYTGGTTISAGQLTLGNAGALGTAANTTAISAGTLDLGAFTTVQQAALNQSGGTVQNGTMLVTTYQLTGGTLAANATINANTAFDLRAGTVNGVLAGAGTVTKTTAGTVTLNGMNTYTGATNVNAGTLQGVGSVNTLTVNGGTFAPGNGTAGSSMTVTGSLAFQSAALFAVQVNPATASFANVTGNATLGGAAVSATFAAGSYVAKQYTIVQATGLVSGTFNPTVVNSNLPSNFHTGLSYDAHDAYLNLALNFAPGTGPGTGLNGNQQNVGNALTNFFNTSGSIPAVFGSLSPAGLSQASGETATGAQQTTFDAMSLFLGLLTDPFIGGRGDNIAAGTVATPFAEFDASNAYAAKNPARSQSERDAYAAIYRKSPAMVTPFNPGWSVWAAGFGGSQTTNGNPTLGSNSVTSRLGAVAVGADYRFSPSTIAGIAFAGGGTNFSVANGGNGRSDLFEAGAFVRHTVGPAYFTAALAYGWQDITTDRTVTIAGIDQLRARFNGNAWSGRIEDGYRFATSWMGITPYAAGQFTTFDLPAYAEQAIVGASTFALAYGAKSVTDTRSEVGVRMDKSWAMPDSIFTLRGRFAWAHDYNTDRSIGATFQTLPGASFIVNGAAQSADKALTTASAEMKWQSGVSLAATFEGEFSGNSSSYAGKGVARYQW